METTNKKNFENIEVKDLDLEALFSISGGGLFTYRAGQLIAVFVDG